MEWIKHSRWNRLHAIEHDYGEYIGTPCGQDIAVYPNDTRTDTPDDDARCRSCLAWERVWRAEETPHA